MIFETHAHYDDSDFDEDRIELLNSMQAAGIGYVVNIGASMEGCRRTLELTRQYTWMYGALGIHPDEVGDISEDDMSWIEENASDSKIVAIGEIGLDYHEPAAPTYPKTSRKLQAEWFERQLDMAKRVNLPVVIHSRDAAQDTEAILRMSHAEDLGGVIHCYSYSKESAGFYLDNGFYIGVGGVITFKNGRRLKEVVEYAPLESLVLETDSPYLAPVPHRGTRNSSLYIPLIAGEIAQIKQVPYEKVIEVTEHNAKKLYRMEERG